MKKQYVKGYGKDNAGREKWVTASLIGVCVITLVVTVALAGILSSPDKAGETPAVATSEESIEVVENTPRKEQQEPEETPREQPAGQPLVFAPPCSGTLLLEFSVDMPVYSETLDDWRAHNGIDIAAPLGTEVKAVADGIISDKYEDFRYGYTVVTDHENGIRTVYSNLSELDTAVIGAQVKKGDVISSVGDTTLFETVADTHVHLEMMLDGEYVNPLNYFSLD